MSSRCCGCTAGARALGAKFAVWQVVRNFASTNRRLTAAVRVVVRVAARPSARPSARPPSSGCQAGAEGLGAVVRVNSRCPHPCPQCHGLGHDAPRTSRRVATLPASPQRANVAGGGSTANRHAPGRTSRSRQSPRPLTRTDSEQTNAPGCPTMPPARPGTPPTPPHPSTADAPRAHDGVGWRTWRAHPAPWRARPSRMRTEKGPRW